MKVYCVFSVELPHRGDSNEYTQYTIFNMNHFQYEQEKQYTIFNMNKKNTLNYPKSAAMGLFPRDSRRSHQCSSHWSSTVVNLNPAWTMQSGQGLLIDDISFPLLSPRTTKLWRGYRVCPVRMYVSTYVRTYVRSFVCSPALATSFIIQFRYNFTQVLDMTIPRTSSRFSMIGSRSRSQWLFLEKLCHHSSAFIYKPILILFHTNV